MPFELREVLLTLHFRQSRELLKSDMKKIYTPNHKLQYSIVLSPIGIHIKRDTGEFVPFELREVLLTLHFRQSRELLKSDMKKIYTPNHKLQYYVDQAKQKGGN